MRQTKFYYEVRQVLQSVTSFYLTVRQVLQSATVITKWDVTHAEPFNFYVSEMIFEVQCSKWLVTYTSRFKIMVSLVFFFNFQKLLLPLLSLVQ